MNIDTEKKRTIAITVLILLIIPVSLGLIYRLNGFIIDPIHPEQETDNNYWNLVSNDEFTYFLTDTINYKDELLTEHQYFLKTTIADISDNQLDHDNITDLTIYNQLAIGTEQINIGFGIPISIDDLLKIFMVFGRFLQLSGYYNSYVDEKVMLSIPINDYNTIQSEFWNYLKYQLNYIEVCNGELDTIIYEMKDYNELRNSHGSQIKTFFNESINNKVNVQIMPNERNWSKGMKFDIQDYEKINKNDVDTQLRLIHSIADKGRFYDSDYTKKATFDINLFSHENQSFVIDLTNYDVIKNNDFNMDKRIEDNSTHSFLIENSSIFYLEKPYYLVWNGGGFTKINNLLAGNWTYLSDVPNNEWYKLKFQIPKGTTYHSYPENFTIQVNDNPIISNVLQMGLEYDQEADYVQYSVIDSTANGYCCIDDWGDEKWDSKTFVSEQFLSPQVDDFRNFFGLFSQININTFMVLPTNFNYTWFQNTMNALIGGLFGSEVLPIYSENSTHFEIQLTPEILLGILGLGESNYTFFEGASDVNLYYLINKETDLMESLRIKSQYFDLDAERTLNMQLIKTKTPEISAETYNYFNGTIYSDNSVKFSKEVNIVSRLYNDDYSDIIQPEQFSIDFSSFFMNLFDELGLDWFYQSIWNSEQSQIILLISTLFVLSFIPSFKIIYDRKFKK